MCELTQWRHRQRFPWLLVLELELEKNFECSSPGEQMRRRNVSALKVIDLQCLISISSVCVCITELISYLLGSAHQS